VDRTLTTLHTGTSQLIWHAAGYPAAPTVSAMVRDLATNPPS
jgi:hypothetical protein